MPQSDSDYSQLIEAILDNDKQASDNLASSLIRRIVIFLKVRMGAPQSVAEECAYQAFSDVFEKIRKDKIKDRKSLLKYFITAARHEYLRVVSKEYKSELYDTEQDFPVHHQADQLELLLDEERQSLLKKCLSKLPEKSRKFILAVFYHKEESLREIAEKFNYTYGKTRTLKTRVLQQLQDCVNLYK